MGLDLRLLPFHEASTFSHNILSCERQYTLFKQVQQLESAKLHTVPEYFNTFIARGNDGNATYGNTQETPYGETLCYVPVRALARVWNEQTDLYPINHAIGMYLQSLPDTWRIALYWH